MDFVRFCRDYSVPFKTEGDKHCRQGWVQIDCPFCRGFEKWHLGYNENGDYFNCYSCGFKPHIKLISELLRISFRQAGDILDIYQGKRPRPVKFTECGPPVVKSGRLDLPPSTATLSSIHRKYLESRGFNPDRLAAEWGLLGTSGLGDYKFRVIAPIYYQGRLVSYQGRDITGKSNLRYKACSKERELVHHKDILYGIDEARGSSVVIVEGIADAWRMGCGAVATFGISFKISQIFLLRRFSRRYILFDSQENQAISQARKLAGYLEAFSGTTEIVKIGYKDPAEMPQSDADELMNELMG